MVVKGKEAEIAMGGVRGMKFSGVNTIVATPFTETDAVDYDSLGRLVDTLVTKGVHAITLLGVAGEAPKLSRQERAAIMARAFETVAGRCSVVVGTSVNTIDETVLASRLAEEAGAAAVMVAPPKGLSFGPLLIAHYSALAKALSIPIILQDLAAVTGVVLSPENMRALIDAVPRIAAIKLETPPTPLRMGALRRLVADDVAVLGGNGGVQFLNELRQGANGTMNGFAYPEALLELWDCWTCGDRAGAAACYAQILPLLVFEFQPEIGLALRKEILRRRGFIQTARLRGVSAPLTAGILADLSETLTSLGVHAKYDAA